MKPQVTLFLCVLFSLGLIAIQPALADSGDYVMEPIGFPRGTGVMKMDITIEVNGVKTTKTVTIPKGDIVPTTGLPRMPGESDMDFAQRVMDNRADFSQKKAAVIAAAINDAFKVEFAAAGIKATTGNKVVSNKSAGNAIYQEGLLYQGAAVSAAYGSVQIPSISKDKDVPSIKFTENKVLGEGGNGGRFLPPPQPSPGTKVGMTSTTPGVDQVAMGSDPYGDPSEVDFGIDGKYVAQVFPTMGMSDANVMQLLASQLNANGVPATYSDSLHGLALDQPLPDGQTLDWGNTDTGLEFTTMFQGLSEPVPEPASWLLSILSLIAICLISSKRLTAGQLQSC